nr:genetic interactor of prohibitins 3, mitochondrial [Quercus suber]
MQKGYRAVKWMLSTKSLPFFRTTSAAGLCLLRLASSTRSSQLQQSQLHSEHGTRHSTTKAACRQATLTDRLQILGDTPIGLETHDLPQITVAQLPASCPGCGAPGQNIDADAPGYYDLSKGRMAGRSGNKASKAKKQEEDEIVRRILKTGALAGADTRTETKVPGSAPSMSASTPFCERCHDLRYQSRGTPIIHPSMTSIQAIIEESPHARNHIYHVLDAADFPMSLIPNLQHALRLPRMRTQNRRSKHRNFVGGRTAEVSFIVTRSDLLAPKKEQVDALMPYMTEVLRDALGRKDKKLRLGNIRCVSAKRGWWTKTVKEEIYDRGGAGWMVGKVNVGKSALFEVVFPKGRNQDGDVNPDRRRQRLEEDTAAATLGLQEMGQDDAANRVEDEEKSKTDMAFFMDSPSELSPARQDNDGPEQFRAEDERMKNSTITSAQPWQDFVTPYFASRTTDLDGDRVLEEDNETEKVEEEAVYDLEDDDASLLPSAQEETAFPEMPLVSSLPGTTASPIRIPFGKGKGELIDLPGVNRSNLDIYVQENYRKDMVMKHRIVPEQYTIRPLQSLLLGGLIRITPRMDEDCVLLAYPFVPTAFAPHLTGTHKAVAIQTGVHTSLSRKFVPAGEEYRGNIPSIATRDAKNRIKSAGIFPLQWDVTKRRTGSLTDKTAGKRKTADLPFTVYSTDILIEGVGWVELVCQVRKTNLQRSGSADALVELSSDPRPPVQDALSELETSSYTERGQRSSSAFPEVEIFAPEGKFIATRRPMNAWLLGGKKVVPVHKRRERPRQTISKGRRREGSVKLR